MPKKKKHALNDFSRVDYESITPPKFKDYHQELFRVPDNQDLFLLKARQIGFTRAAAWMSLYLAVVKNKNQIHISASKNQVNLIRVYMFDFAETIFGVTLRGQNLCEITSLEGEKVYLRFCSTNSRTAQSHNGDLWIDEFAWIPKAEELLDTALGMTANNKYRVVYITTPSTVSHPAYLKWKQLNQEGEIEPDDTKRIQIDLDEALKRGCDWLSEERLMRRFGKQRFQRLFRLLWINDSKSLFKLEQIQALCAKDDQGEFLESFPKTSQAPTVVGVDPNAGGGDGFGIVLCELGDKLRVKMARNLYNQTLDQSLSVLKNIMRREKRAKLVYDASGMGQGMKEKIQDWDREKIPLEYDYEIKQKLVWRMERLVSDKKIELLYKQQDLIQSFLTIKNASTPSGKHTFKSSRTKTSGHGDLFWSLAHAATLDKNLDQEKFFQQKRDGRINLEII